MSKVVEPRLKIVDGPDKPITAKNPDALKYENAGGGSLKVVRDDAKSESAIILSGHVNDNVKMPALPNVFYLGRMNKYFKDVNCTNLMSDEELIELGLPIPAEIENERKKLRKKVIDGDLELDTRQIIHMTAPKKMNPKRTAFQQSVDTINKELGTK